MESEGKLKVLLIAPYYDRAVPGESWSTYKWVEGISAHCETTVLTYHRPGWDPASSPVGAREVVDWDDITLPKRFERIAWEMKPGYIFFYRKVRGWIREALARGRSFDLVHQINPLALRYPCPAVGLGIPFIIGPLAGSLETPKGFAGEGTDRQWFRKLRYLDKLRIRRDPLLRRTYARAHAVIGVAPYVRDVLGSIPLRRFEVMSETGITSLDQEHRPLRESGVPLKLLFVGRVIRTKGVIDAVRALARLPDDCRARLDVLGVGDQLEQCRAEVKRLDLNDRVTFHGRVSRQEVDKWYRCSDVFLFPSFREPSGNVVMEAMGHGLPVITCTNGGPGHVVDETCGLRVPAENPEQLTRDLANAIQVLASDPDKTTALSAGAAARVQSLALWDQKIARMKELYEEISVPSYGAAAGG